MWSRQVVLWQGWGRFWYPHWKGSLVMELSVLYVLFGYKTNFCVWWDWKLYIKVEWIVRYKLVSYYESYCGRRRWRCFQFSRKNERKNQNLLREACTSQIKSLINNRIWLIIISLINLIKLYFTCYRYIIFKIRII